MQRCLVKHVRLNNKLEMGLSGPMERLGEVDKGTQPTMDFEVDEVID